MFKKVLSIGLIVLMLFSCFNMINAGTLTVHARTQDNDDNYGILVFHSTDDWYNNIIGEHWISKGDTRTFDLNQNDVWWIEFKSPGKNIINNAKLRNLQEFFQDNPDANISVDVNFYKYGGYGNKMFISYPCYVVAGGRDKYYAIRPAWNQMSNIYKWWGIDESNRAGLNAGWHG